MKTIGYLIAGLVLANAPLTAHADTTAPPASGNASSLLDVKVPAAVVAKAIDPKPPADAKKGASIGRGKTVVDTSDGPGDEDAIWVEQIDIDGDVEKTDLLWDDEAKVLYLYAADNGLKCKGGGDATADLLIAINGKENVRRHPAGSGFYVATLDEGKCKAEAAESWGCQFDAKGDPQVCSVAEIDAKNDELVSVTVSR